MFTRWRYLKALVFLLAFVPLSGYSQVTLTGTSYIENFDGIGSGLPTGWTVNTGANASSTGTNATVTTAATDWGNTSGAFKNFASADGLTGTENSATQSSATDRVLGIRQTGSFGDPGAAFMLTVANTTGFQNLSLSFKAQMLSVQTRSTIGRLITVLEIQGTSPF